MCGRYSYRYRWSDVYRILDGLGPIHPPYEPELRPRYNVRPGEKTGAPVVRRIDGALQAESLWWSFIANEMAKFKPINAKAESLFDKWPWKFHWAQHRCVIPMSGFYEPKGPSKMKHRPQYYFQLPDHQLFFVAGIWAPQCVTPLDTYALITTTPNEQVESIHDRMPVMIEEDAIALWLSDSQDKDALESVLKPWAGPTLECWQVDRERLNHSDDESCLASIAPN